jgi:GNAT superfamily N-acetyltransferase
MGLEATVDPAEVEPLLDDFAARLLRLTPADPRSDLRARFEDPLAVKAVWRDARGAVVGAALATVEGTGSDLALLHILPAYADATASARLLDTVIRGLPPSVARLRAMDRLAHRWLHLAPADTRAVLTARGFSAFDRVLLARDLRKPVPPPAPLPAGYTLSTPDPRQVDRYSDFAFRAYRGTTDFPIIAPDASLEAYTRLYRRFLSGELGEYASALSFAVEDEGRELAAVLHTILVGRDPYVGDLSVLAPHRRKHLGRFLLTTALQRYKDTGLARAALTVTAQNTAAYNLYRSLGFEVERSGEVFILAR